MNVDSEKISSTIHTLEAYRLAHGIDHDLRAGDGDVIVEEILRQERVIQNLLPDDWSIEYNAPFYQINLFK